ncbi:MAG: hypothetical protein P8184_01540 [Calditrichia bacterium]
MIAGRTHLIFLSILLGIIFIDACSNRDVRFRKERTQYQQSVERMMDSLARRIAELNADDDTISEGNIIGLEHKMNRLDLLDNQLNRAAAQLDTVTAEHWNSLKVYLDSLLSRSAKAIKRTDKSEFPDDTK